MSGTFLDDATLLAIEKDLDSAHKSFGHGNLAVPSGKQLGGLGLHLLEVAGPAAALSYFNARATNGELMLGPVPADLGLGLGLVALAALGLGGSYEDDLLNVGTGCVAAYAARAGAYAGMHSPLPASTTPTSTSGYPDIVGKMGQTRDNVAGLPGAAAGAAVQMTGMVPGTKRLFVKKAV